MAQKKSITIALAGNPNSGKTSIFNSLTGARQQVGNWPGVTVEKKVGHLIYREYDVTVVDLPGTYSLTAYSVEERVVRSYIVDDRPDVVVHVVDSGNLARNLYLTVQLLELEVDLVVDLNMWDEFEESGAELDLEKIHRLLGAPIVPTIGHRSEGIDDLLDAAIDLVEDREDHHRHIPVSYGPQVDDVLIDLTTALEESGLDLRGYPPRWTAIKLLESDREIVELIAAAHGPKGAAQGVSETASRAARHIRTATGTDPEKVISEGRSGYVEGALREALTEQLTDRMELSRRIDNVFTNRFLGYPIFLLMIWILFQATFQLGAFPKLWMQSFVSWIGTTLGGLLPQSLISDLIVNGIVGGVGSVVVFLPNIMILFLGIAFLEDSGYMARAAFLMDRMMHALGLHGKSFIPMLMGFGCSVPAIMATRMLESRRDRILTALLVPLMSCSARLPVYVLIAGTFFAGRAGSVVFAVYVIGIVAAMLIGRLFARTLFRSTPAPFVMELPPYRLPTAKGLVIHMWERARVYLQKMGGVILVASILMWFLGAFPRDAETVHSYEADIATLRGVGTAEAVAQANSLERELSARLVEDSYIGRAGNAVYPVVKPLGFSWQMGVSLITGFVAKEVVVSTLGVLYHADAREVAPHESLPDELREPSNGITPLAAFAFMVFVLLYTPCIVSVIAIKREVGTGWMWFSIGYQLVLAWVVSAGVYQVGSLLGL
ncbi:MAG: ferrous iron transport protein B [Candidatus Eisenbacteria bacterium]|nr:ferrous iron transport protein B [Candidatus Eisenbacteria bacterium]